MTSHATSNRIVVHPDVCGGRPVVRGTRITAQTVLEFLAAGDTVQSILAEYPSLEEADVLACIAYGAKTLSRGFSWQAMA